MGKTITKIKKWLSSVQFSCSVVSNSLWPHELQHARPPCPSPTPGVHSNSCSLCRSCHPAISSSVVPFSSFPQSLTASESFPISQLFAWGGQLSKINKHTNLIECITTFLRETNDLFQRSHRWSILYTWYKQGKLFIRKKFSEIKRSHTDCAALCAKSLQLCPTLWDPMHHRPPDSSSHEILQARIWEWVAISFSWGSSQPRDGSRISYVSCIGRHVLYH